MNNNILKISPRNLARILCYGLEQAVGDEDYCIAVIEGLAHLGACVISQDMTGEATDIEDIIEMLKDKPDAQILEKRILIYLKTVYNTL